MKMKIFDSYFLSIDLDNEKDIIELLIHGKGKINLFLKKIFYIDIVENKIKKHNIQKINIM